MIEEWLATSWTEVWLVLVSSIGIFLFTVLVIRVNGLRSLSKMSSFDFAVTVAIGSLIAAVAISSTSVVNGMIALAAVMGAQRLMAMFRLSSRHVESIVDNEPLLLMAGERMIGDNMARARVTEADIKAKLRAANVLELSRVRAVVFETTGDVSVLHGEVLDASLLEGVRGAELLTRS